MTIASNDEDDKRVERRTDTGGGTCVEGDVNIEDGDLVGRDKRVRSGGVTIEDSEVTVKGDVVGGNKTEVHGDQIIVQVENLRDMELAYLDGLLKKHEYWRDHYTPLAGIAEVRAAARGGPRLDLPMPLIPRECSKLVEHGFGEHQEIRREQVDDLSKALTEHKRIILLGDPGSGKTTTLRRLAYDYALAAKEDEGDIEKKCVRNLAYLKNHV